ncbi:hypothetical protein ACFLTE_07560 [Bacteroidota bacterium]
MNLKILQNYSDIRGIAVDDIADQININEDIIAKLSAAFIQWIDNNNPKEKKLLLGEIQD